LGYARYVGMSDRQSRRFSRVKPGKHPALLEHAIPQPGKVFAIIGRMKFRQVTIAKDTHLFRIPDGVAADSEAGEALRLALECGDQNDPARMETVSRTRSDTQCLDEFAQCVGELSNLWVARQRVRLSETRRVWRNASEMLSPLLHQRLVFSARPRALMDHEQRRALPAAAVMDLPGSLRVLARDGENMACDRGQ